MNRTIMLASVLALLTTQVGIAKEPSLSPVPEYSFRSWYEASEEDDFPRAVYSPDNTELFDRAVAMHNFFQTELSKPETAMRHIQECYDRILSGLTGSDESKMNTPLGSDESVLGRLSWIPEVPQTVESGAPVPFSLKLRNDSDREVVVTKSDWGFEKCFVLPSIRLKKLGNENCRVRLAKMGAFYFWPRYEEFSSSVRNVRGVLPVGSEISVLNEPSGAMNLADFYELNEPGEYELEFRTRRFVNEDGTPAEDSDRAFPAPKTIRFTILPVKEKSVLKKGMTFHFETPEEARRELSNPAPSRVPDNADLVARIDATSSFTDNPPRLHMPGEIHRLAAEYESVLDLLVVKKGDCNDQNAEKFSGLKWRVDTPQETPMGRPVILKLGLTNISDTEEYRICKYDAMRDKVFLSSTRLVRITETGDEEDVPMTKLGTARFYDTEWNCYRERKQSFMTFTSTGDLPPNRSVWLASAGFAYPPDLDLAEYFDLSKPGEYELTFYTRRFLDKDGNPAKDQQRKYPRPDIVRFRITEPAESQ